ncbi:uncharacterized protein LOC143023355 [Oratosquilla oratoria]|uniref:uncharacterized protein LOC143023355 n=1 Tax=Oratosquilla oratoria TaxID=337810 RepID=UPI003F763F11
MENDTAFKKVMQRLAERQAASTKSPTISEEKYDAIRCHLLDPSEKVDPHFRHWVKRRKFQIVNIPGLGLHQVLVIPNEQRKQLDGCAKFLRVVHAGNLYDVVKGIHVDELSHCGYKKLKNYVDRHYFGITRGFIQEYCKYCPVCQLSQPQVTRPPLRPIVHKDFLERVQVDLIDMRHSPDRDYHYIGHFMDHFSKYHVLFPLKQKSAEEVGRLLEERVLAYFGPPNIFHSDNGREFVNQLIQTLFSRWGGKTAFVNGRPRHSQSQGLVERGNQIVDKRIAAMKQEEKVDDDAVQYPWASWLPRIQFSMNCTKHETIQDAPYHVVFGRSVPAGLFPGAQGCFAEEDIRDVEDRTEDKEDEISQPPPPAQELISQPSPRTNPILKPIAAPRLFKPAPRKDKQPSQPPLDDATNQPSPLPQEDPSQSLPLDDSQDTSPSPPQPEPPVTPENQPSSTRHSSIRKRALENTYISAARMSEFYNRRKRVQVQEFSVGDRVSIAVPKLDRTAMDLPRIPAVVSAIHGSMAKKYSLSTAYGVINTKFTGGDLQAYSGDVEMSIEKHVSLREAAQKFNPENRFLKAHCSCKGSCKTDKCSCRANGIQCSTHCHLRSTCANRAV